MCVILLVFVLFVSALNSAVIESLESMCADINWFNSHDISDKSRNNVTLQTALHNSAPQTNTADITTSLSSPSTHASDKKKTGHPIESLVWTNSVGQYQDIVVSIPMSMSPLV